MAEPDTYAMGDLPNRSVDAATLLRKISDEEQWITDEELQRRLETAEKRVTVYIFQFVHTSVSAIFCLGFFWGLFAKNSASGGLLACAILSTISVVLMILITSGLLGGVKYKINVYLHVENFSSDMAIKGNGKRKAYSYFLHNAPLPAAEVDCLRQWRNRRLSVVDVSRDPHSMSLEWIRDYIVAAGETFSFKKLVVITVFMAYMLFYPLIGFYVSLIIWSWNIVKRLQTLDLSIPEAVV